MRPVPFTICLLCLVLGSVLGYDFWQRWKARHPTAGSQASVPTDALATAGEPRDRAAAVTAPEEGSRLPPWQYADVRRAVAEWRFLDSDGAALLRARETPKLVALRAEWTLKHELATRARDLEPDLPKQVQRLTLTNGRTLWARSVREFGDGLEVVLVSGVGTTLDASAVARRDTRERLQYLEHTEVEYRQSLEGLPDEPSALEAAVARALARDDHSAADGLYARWLLAGGSDALVRRLPAAEGARVAAAATALAVPIQRPEPDANLTRATRPRPRLDHSVPVSVEALDRKLRKMRTEVTPRLLANRRQRFLDQLEVWEEWLVGPARDEVRHEDELKRLQKEMQFLRLDLLKTGGF